MPSKISAPSLQKCACRSIIKDIHSVCVSNKMKDSKSKRNSIAQLISQTPFNVQQVLLCDLIDYLFTTLPKRNRTEKMDSYLEVALSPALRLINLNDFFYKIRLSRDLDQTLRNVVKQRVSVITYLTSFSMAGHCDDIILETISHCCIAIEVLSFSHSSLVTDSGIRALVKRATSIKEIYCMECPSVNPESIKELIENLPKLRVLHYIDLFIALSKLEKYPKECHTLELTDFVQVGKCFNATLEELVWMRRILTKVVNIRLYLDDSFPTNELPIFPNLKTVHIEIPTLIGKKFLTCFKLVANTITQLGLSCNGITHNQIRLIGKECHNLKVLNMMIAKIGNNEVLFNDGSYYKNLENLILQVYQERPMHSSYFDMFVLHSPKLRLLNIKVPMPFLDDTFLLNILRTNPLTQIQQIMLSSDSSIPLTKRSAYHLIDKCAELEHLMVTSWQVDQIEFNEIKNFCSDKNYYFTLS